MDILQGLPGRNPHDPDFHNQARRYSTRPPTLSELQRSDIFVEPKSKDIPKLRKERHRLPITWLKINGPL